MPLLARLTAKTLSSVLPYSRCCTSKTSLLLFLLQFVCVVTGTSAPALSYSLTTTAGPVLPGQGIQFTVTVTNLSIAVQTVSLTYNVPQFTTSNGYPAWTALSYYMGNLPAGTTHTVTLNFTVLSGTQSPPDGSLTTLVASDRVHGALVSRTATVN